MATNLELIARILQQIDNIATAVASLHATIQAQSAEINELKAQLAGVDLTEIDTKLTALAGTLGVG